MLRANINAEAILGYLGGGVLSSFIYLRETKLVPSSRSELLSLLSPSLFGVDERVGCDLPCNEFGYFLPAACLYSFSNRQSLEVE